MTIDWQMNIAAIWRSRRMTLQPVRRLDPVRLDSLLGIDIQKQKIIDNTERYLSGLPANNALLWGSRGTGKSSLIKALLNTYSERGLRVIEVNKGDLVDLPEIVDNLHDLAYKFIVFCDDLSFEEGDNSYKHLKSVLEGSLELPPENVLIYATSNRRHLIPELQSDNLMPQLGSKESQITNGEIHYGDVVEEKLSLADRFGLWLSFYPFHWDRYFDMVELLFQADEDKYSFAAIKDAARQFAMVRASHSGRTAKQFYQSYINQHMANDGSGGQSGQTQVSADANNMQPPGE